MLTVARRTCVLPGIPGAPLAPQIFQLRRKDTFDYELVATVLDDDAQPLARIERSRRVALLFGSEGHGPQRSLVNLCDRKVTIPMQPGTDSLNVAVAAGVIVHHYLCLARSGCESG